MQDRLVAVYGPLAAGPDGDSITAIVCTTPQLCEDVVCRPRERRERRGVGEGCRHLPFCTLLLLRVGDQGIFARNLSKSQFVRRILSTSGVDRQGVVDVQSMLPTAIDSSSWVEIRTVPNCPRYVKGMKLSSEFVLCCTRFVIRCVQE